ncbi:MAG: 2-succinyl-5-enolpyruvyl-6-hydroxy-3-cyclohexene-1-carboxylic-acid synthase [Actinomycetota bacterium]
MNEGDIALACMRAFAGALVRSGVGEVGLSPGSRSTPLALAVARERGLRAHVHLDERASAFFALGVAKATGYPAAVLTTSGTAAANLLPAVVEASMARVPLLLLTADRPPELRGVGANQTIDQLELFGRFVRWFVDADVPSASEDALGAWEDLARRAVARSLGPTPGPVHVNLPFREPLVPSGAEVALGDAPTGRTVEGHPPRPAPTSAEIDMLREVLSLERGVIVAGSLRAACRPALDLGERRGWPVLGEPTSGLRVPGTLSTSSLMLGDPRFAKDHVPQVLLQLGAAPTSRAGLGFTAGAERLVIVDPDGLVGDPAGHADLRIEADPASLLETVLSDLRPASSSSWLDGWRRADAAARRAVDDVLAMWDEPYEGRIARDLAACPRDDATLVVGSSMPVRDLDAYMAPRNGLRVLANRGASGIDGFVSTVLGVSVVAEPPTFALCGDLTLLHDAGSLLWSAQRGYDAVFVVPNNDGGGIFDLLGQSALPELNTLFVTPHGLDLARLAHASGAGYERVEHASDLVGAIERAAAGGGIRIVEAPIDRQRSIARRAEIAAAVASALERS